MNKEVSPEFPREKFEGRIASFETEKGCIYSYDSEKTTLLKRLTGELHNEQCLTVFANLSLQERRQVFFAYHHIDEGDNKLKVCVFEKKADNSEKIIVKKAEIKKQDELYLGIFDSQQKSFVFKKKVSLVPIIGHNIFTIKHYKKDGKCFSERRLGHKVTKINY